MEHHLTSLHFFITSLPFPCCVSTIGKSSLELHGFADASKMAVCAAIYAVSYCGESPIDRNLGREVESGPKKFSIPTLELVAAHTWTKLQNNVENAQNSSAIASFHSCSVTVLYWLSTRGEWCTFVRNRVKKIKTLSHTQVRTRVTSVREELVRDQVAYRWIHWSYSTEIAEI